LDGYKMSFSALSATSPLSVTSRTALTAASPVLSATSGPGRQILPADTAITYRINDVVALSGLGRSSIYNLIKAGKLKSMVVAGRRLVDAASLRDLLRGAA
jgi:Helix-turn-helix domain